MKTFQYYLKDCLRIEIDGVGIKKILNMLFNPPFNSVFLIRLQMFFKTTWIKRIIQRKLVNRYGIFISDKTTIDIGLKLPHPNGIVLGRSVCIGRNCIIFQQVTIGSRNVLDEDEVQANIGNDCIIGAGAKIIGTITVADRSIIGDNAVLTHSTDADGIYVGIPAKKKKR